ATILHTPIFDLPNPKDGESIGDYHNRLLTEIARFLRTQTQVPPPSPADPVADYAELLGEAAAQNLVWQGLFDVEWRSRTANLGKNDLVDRWSSLGFVVPRAVGNETV